MTKRKLSRKDWITAGFKALRKGGPQAVRVEAIAKALKVSKGSFYWHFKNAADLKGAMLEYWFAIATTFIISEVESDLEANDRTLEKLVEITSAGLGHASQDAALNEASMRDWARYDPSVARVMQRVDAKRLEFVAEGFERSGFSPLESRENAKTLYAALIGLDYLTRHGMARIEQDLPRVLEILLQSKTNE